MTIPNVIKNGEEGTAHSEASTVNYELVMKLRMGNGELISQNLSGSFTSLSLIPNSQFPIPHSALVGDRFESLTVER